MMISIGRMRRKCIMIVCLSGSLLNPLFVVPLLSALKWPPIDELTGFCSLLCWGEFPPVPSFLQEESNTAEDKSIVDNIDFLMFIICIPYLKNLFYETWVE